MSMIVVSIDKMTSTHTNVARIFVTSEDDHMHPEWGCWREVTLYKADGATRIVYAGYGEVLITRLDN